MMKNSHPISVRVLMVVDSWSGHTAKAGEQVALGAQSMGAELVIRSADEATYADLKSIDALIMGSAVHQRSMTWKMKQFVDEVCEPAWFYDNLVGRVGGVFTTGGGHGQSGGGCEMAQLGMLANLAACGMILVSLPKTTPGFEHAGMHWGPTIKTTEDSMRTIDINKMDEEALSAFFHHGANIARISGTLKGISLAKGNPWPSAGERNARQQAEAEYPADQRLRHRADPMPRSFQQISKSKEEI